MRLQQILRLTVPVYVLTTLALIGLFGAAAGPLRAAQDGKFYPGTLCKVFQDSHEDRNQLRFRKFGMVVNQSSQKRVRVVCPIVRDEMNTNRGVFVRVFVHDSNPNDRLACELMETSAWGELSNELDRAETPDFVVQHGPRQGQNLGSLCNTGIAGAFGSGINGQRVDCSLGLRLQSSGKWDRAEPGSGLHLICGLPARTTAGEFNGRSAIGGYFVEESTE